MRVGLVWHREMHLRKTAATAIEKAGFRRAMTEYGFHLSFRPLGVRKKHPRACDLLDRFAGLNIVDTSEKASQFACQASMTVEVRPTLRQL
jgi:hypothetical protein